ncbi:MAG: hypothetical protein M1820_005828 [Bogoriella megaspora]|nr:MAG: hypothetical protein M1820_005828 [Bogoriella megaspora]
MLGKRGHSEFDECTFGFQEPGKKLRLSLFTSDESFNGPQTHPFHLSASPQEIPTSITPGAEDMMTPATQHLERHSSMPTEPLAFPRATGGWRSPSTSASGDLPDLEMDDDDEDSDIDATGSQPSLSPRPWARPPIPFSRPSWPASRPSALPGCPTINEPNQLSGRIPTPIYSTFNMEAPGVPREGLGISRPTPVKPININRLRVEADRPLPSPITEDLNSPAHLTANQFSKLGMCDEEMDMDGQEPKSPGFRTGRARSDAITEKKRFAMGYRQDCIKCQTRVPGHFSHFLPDYD